MKMDLWKKFVDITTRHFEFLETDFRFERQETQRPFINYKSIKLKVSIYYGERYELDLRIRKLSDDPRRVPSIGIGMLMQPPYSQSTESYLSPFPSTPEDLEIEVQRLATLLKKYGSGILKAA